MSIQTATPQMTPPPHLLLPPIELPDQVEPFIVDFNAPFRNSRLSAPNFSPTSGLSHDRTDPPAGNPRTLKLPRPRRLLNRPWGSDILGSQTTTRGSLCTSYTHTRPGALETLVKHSMPPGELGNRHDRNSGIKSQLTYASLDLLTRG